MARRRKGRDVSGILLLDKPQGLSSNQALQRVKRLYSAAKAGHTGALDPLATGLLPLCLGEATKFSQYLLDADKRYCVTARLGEKTDTADAEGKVVSTRPIPAIDTQQLADILCTHFSGLIDQYPPIYSALKYQGQPLYKLARRGIEVPIKSRQVRIDCIDILKLTPESIELDITCSKGTYIRSLVDDLGELLGCGAHVSQLRRLQSGPFGIGESVSLNTLQDMANEADSEGIFFSLDRLLLPAWSPLGTLPSLCLDETSAERFGYGQRLKPDTSLPAGEVKLFTGKIGGQFIGVGELLDDGTLVVRRLVKQD